MPTPRGWFLCLLSCAGLAAGRLLGLTELYVLAAAGPPLLLAAVAYVRSRPVVLAGHRRLPVRVPAGGEARVELTLTNRGRLRTPVLDLADGIGGRQLLPAVDSLDPGGEIRTVYVVEARRRGLLRVGPVRIRVTDPFGLAARVLSPLPASTLVVHPRVDAVHAPPEPSGAGTADGRRPVVSPLAGEDFHSLRPYESGEDMRLVHWRSSARRGDLLVRQYEAARTRHTTVVVDLRRSVQREATVEAVISAAASVAAAALHDDGLVRVVTTGGLDTGAAGGELHLEAALDHLAAVDVDSAQGLEAVTTDVTGSTLILVTTSAARSEDLGRLGGWREGGHLLGAVVFDLPGMATSGPLPVDWLVRVGTRERFSVAWERGVDAAFAAR